MNYEKVNATPNREKKRRGKKTERLESPKWS